MESNVRFSTARIKFNISIFWIVTLSLKKHLKKQRNIEILLMQKL